MNLETADSQALHWYDNKLEDFLILARFESPWVINFMTASAVFNLAVFYRDVAQFLKT